MGEETFARDGTRVYLLSPSITGLGSMLPDPGEPRQKQGPRSRRGLDRSATRHGGIAHRNRTLGERSPGIARGASVSGKREREVTVVAGISERRTMLTAWLPALGQYSSTRVTGALVGVLRTEKDPGLRRRSHESLVRITGRQLPPEADVWENYLRDPNSVPGPSIGERFSELLPIRWSSE